MTPPRGFPPSEFEARVARAQTLMETYALDALLLTTEPEVRYFTGFLTRFWESPTRPWFVVLPARGAPIAVIPAIGAHLMGQTWVDDIRTWAAPNYEDDGIGLLAKTLREGTPKNGRIGLADQLESHVRMPLDALRKLEQLIGDRRIENDHEITSRLRQIKSDAEIAKISRAVTIATRAFDRVPEIATPGTPLSTVFRRFQMLCLEEGADWVPYLAGAAGHGGYGDVISPATDVPLAKGDVLMLDTGLVWDGYFCDFDRNYALGPCPSEVNAAHARLIEATAAAFDQAKPGATMADLYHAMAPILSLDDSSGRQGHGLGMQLTEGPSILPFDHTPLAAGMVLTLEPSITLGPGRMLVHEENIVIRDHSAAYLSQPQGSDIRVLG
ncbi:MAG: M24 family metallopeptidase [Paracoccaceae bacterium]